MRNNKLHFHLKTKTHYAQILDIWLGPRGTLRKDKHHKKIVILPPTPAAQPVQANKKKIKNLMEGIPTEPLLQNPAFRKESFLNEMFGFQG